MAIKQYPLGIQTFERIRKEDKLYIDKTEYIYRMTHSDGTYFFVGDHAVLESRSLFRPCKVILKVRKTCLKDLPWNSLKKNG